MLKKLRYGFIFFLAACGVPIEDDAPAIDFSPYQVDDIEEVEISTNYLVEVITDTAEISLINLRIDGLTAERSADKDRSLGYQYSIGVESAKAKIIDLFKTDKTETQIKVLRDLNTIDRNVRLHNDSQFCELLYRNLTNWRVEEQLIELMAFQELPNYEVVLEKHLLSGNSMHEDEIIYQLGYNGKSIKTLNYFEKKLNSTELGSAYLSQALYGLDHFYSYGDDKIKAKVEQLCLLIYDLDLIKKEEYGSIEHDYSYGNPAKQLLQLIFRTKNPLAMPIAERFKDVEVVEDDVFYYLVRMEAEPHRKKIIELMQGEDTYYTGLEVVSDFYHNTKDDRILISAIRNFESNFAKGDLYGEYDLYLLNNELEEAVGDSARYYFNTYLRDDQITADLFELRKQLNESITEITNYLVEINLLEEYPDTIGLAKKTETDKYNRIYTILGELGLYFWLDTDVYNPIKDLDFIVDRYKYYSNNKLENLRLDVYYKDNKSEESEFIAVLNSKAYRMFVPRSEESDYEYFSLITYLINFILEDQGIPQRFVDLGYDEYIFGDPSAVELLCNKYNIYIEN